MTVRYHNTFRDVMGFCFYHYPRSPVVIGTYGLGFALISVSVFQALPKDAGTAGKVLTFLITESIAFAFVAGVLSLSVVLSMISRRNNTILTEHSITLGEDGFTSETPYVKAEQKWAVVQKLVRTRRYIFIYVAQCMAHVVPRRAFQDETEWDAFYELCRNKTRAA